MGLELADIFRQYGPAYRQKYADQMLPSHRQAMRAIEQCRTEALGGQVYTCPQCGEVQYSYHSCRNRHCPKCQNDKAQEWLEAQQDLLLPVPYFMLTFTLPAALCEVVRSNQSLFYNLLFRISAAATQHLAKDPRFVGGQIGMVGILHTWGRNLAYHPHIHYLVPAGGLAADTQTWLPARQDFLLPVKALSKIFRGKFRQALAKTALFARIPSKVWQQDWVVHCKPVGNGRTALKYLAPYVFRVAISNRRLVKLENDQVTFRYRATDTGQLKAVYTLRRRVHPPLLAACAAQRLRQGALLRLLCSWLPQTPGCFAPTARAEVPGEFGRGQKLHQSQPIQPQSQSCRCPSCGQPLLFQRTIQPTGRCPP